MNLPDTLGALLRRAKLILLNVLVLTVLAAVVSFMLPYRYAASARVLPPPEDDPLGLTAQLSAGLTGQLSRLRTGMFGGGTASDLMVGILSSNTVMESVVVQCSVISRNRIRRGGMEAAIKELKRATALSVGVEGIVTITAEARQPDWAADIANCYVRQLDVFLRSSNMSRGRNMRLFAERRLEEVGRQVDSARAALAEFQGEYGLAAVDDQLSGVVSAHSGLRSSLVVKQTYLHLLEAACPPGSPFLTGLQAEVSAYQRELRDLAAGVGSTRSDGFFGLSMDSMPAVVAEHLRRFGELTLLQDAYSMIYQQFEYARIMEARDTPTITVLDHAAPPERRSFPRRMLIVVIAFVFSLAIGVCYALVEDYFRRLPVSHPETAGSWLHIRDQLVRISESLRGLLRRSKSQDR